MRVGLWVGSSPRVRGRLATRGFHVGHQGLIPASAGQTQRLLPLGLHRRAHPRECGADSCDTLDVIAEEGSSPRVRGRLLFALFAARLVGLIPASAGQTSGSPPGAHRRRAHPRECGADRASSHRQSATQGSSPRVRGRPSGPGSGLAGLGLIPASAGQTPLRALRGSVGRAHPRECGADRELRASRDVSAGSSPRVRGRHTSCHSDDGLGGLIPASAGQTSTTRKEPSVGTAHPRECGADRADAIRGEILPGSSPRVRGRQDRRIPPLAREGLIPASAGQTASCVLAVMFPRAHPRECGADTRLVIPTTGSEGSSPRVRGRPVGCGEGAVVVGLIPASAGQTSRRVPF